MKGQFFLMADRITVAGLGKDIATSVGVSYELILIGGTALVTETYRASEKTRVQGFNDMLVFGTMAVSSSSAGVLVNAKGWDIVNYAAIPFLSVALIAVIWLMLRERSAAARASG